MAAERAESPAKLTPSLAREQHSHKERNREREGSGVTGLKKLALLIPSSAPCLPHQEHPKEESNRGSE